ncbi:MAG: insulinase family protein [Rhodospirillaceae bacterium]|jgi:predicted Zn-dependent peptidase|nr:insulinase family protein [Rhodospirillaceae bacterium]MBT3809654.1 insulinase family protein [Rhodospirillaceae bacterium]MBT3931097.1 insulinase family protein [Rhodospirillaceae bacterium]MBT4772907.1 insulinase family protein [Rhodospirillaceae bacterium]MBT5358272.1 insulinase family protein [Rhodospirillaceae bacterium]
MSEVQITTLSNGVRVVSDEMPTVESVSIGLWVRAGARFETPEVNGVAHLLEHMMFKGTPRRTSQQIAETIENVGGHINAYTAREVTAYYAKVLKNDAALAIDVIADFLQNSLIDEHELTRERSVVLQEIGQARDTPDDVVFDNFQAVAFPEQPLGRPVLGRPDVVGQMSRDAIVGFHDQHYHGGSIVLAAAGSITHDALVALAEQHLADIPPGTPLGLPTATYAGGEIREERDLEQVHFVIGFRGAPVGTDEYYALSVLSNLFGGGMSSRLFQEIRERRGLVYSIDTFLSAFSDEGVFGVYAGTGPDLIEEFVPALCDEISRLSSTLSEDEIARARTQLKANLLMGMESTGARAERAGQQMLLYDRVVSVGELVEKIENVTPETLAISARQLLQSTPCLATIGPATNMESFDAIRRRLAA